MNVNEKSYKFNITITSQTLEKNKYTLNLTRTIDGHCHTKNYDNDSNFTNLIAPDWVELGKTYTIEIKEKE